MIYRSVNVKILITNTCADMLLELARREKNAGIKPDEDLDLFMKVCEFVWCISLTYALILM